MEILLLAARFVLAAVFGVAGLAKLRDAEGSRKSFQDFGVPSPFTPALAVLLPLAELACAIALLFDRWVSAGAIGAMALLTVFIMGITLGLARGRTVNCHCFGQLSSSPVSWWTLVRNVALLTLAGAVAVKADKLPSAWPALSLNFFQTGILAAIGVLAVALALTLSFLLQIVRQNGRLMLRLEAVERRLSIDSKTAPDAGIPIGDPAPLFELKSIEGGTTSLQHLTQAGQPVLLVFTEPGCEACEALQPALAQWQREHAARVRIVPISRGAEELNRAGSAAHGLHDVLLQADLEVVHAYRVTAAPSAILVVNGKVASPMAMGPDAIRALVARSTLPPPVKKGDAAPSIKLADLAGKTLDLASLHGRRTLLLFWSPACGHCQQMLPNVKTWKVADGEPELVVISSGSLEANHAQGFSCQVLLDPHFACGQAFGASGTPSAVVIDEDGRVASEVAGGAPAVFALAGRAANPATSSLLIESSQPLSQTYHG